MDGSGCWCLVLAVPPYTADGHAARALVSDRCAPRLAGSAMWGVNVECSSRQGSNARSTLTSNTAEIVAGKQSRHCGKFQYTPAAVRTTEYKDTKDTAAEFVVRQTGKKRPRRTR